MNFLQPQFLYGLFALSIPIIVHLFNFRKAKKVYFPNTVFLEQVKQSSSAKRKVKHYLILLSRLLAILFLVLAFAQPFIPSKDEGLQKNHVVIYLDTSHSMSNLTSAEIPGLDEGISYTNQLIRLYPRETQFLLLTSDFDNFSNRLFSSDKISDRLTEIRLSNMTRTSAEVHQRIAAITLANNVQDYDLFWISDFQKSTLPEIDALAADSSLNLHLLPIAFTTITNLSVDSVYQDNPFSIEHNKSKVTALVKNYGAQAINEATLKLYINDRQVSSKTVSLEGNSQAEINFDAIYDLSKINRAYLAIEDYPITFDNQFYFMLEQQKPLEIIEIRGDVNTLAIEKVYGNKELFSFSMMPEGNINYNRLINADLIILHSLSALPASLSDQLISYLQTGGRLAIIPSESFDASSYNTLINAQIRPIDLENDPPMLSLQRPDLNDPFYADIFQQRNATFSMPSARNLITWKGLNPLLKSNNGDAYLSFSEQNGMTYLFASPFSTEYTDLTQQALFVPIMYKIASHRSSKISKLYYDVSSTNITVQLDSVVSDELYTLHQNDKELIPSQSIKGNSIVLDIPKGQLVAGYAQLKNDEWQLSELALNADRIESDPNQWSGDDLQRLQQANPNINLFSNLNSDNFTKELKASYMGTALWKYAIAMALLFLFIEILIINYYNPTGK